MARPRRQTYTMSQYLENVNEGYITNDADTQRNPAWKPIVDGLAVTVLTDDYIPSLILAEQENGQKHIVDGGSRTAALMMIRYGNYKIKSSVENPIIKYKSMKRDENGNINWSDSEFDIRNKTYDQFPKELQKAFNEYQIETVIHECDSDGIAMYLRRYNVHTAMNANQKMFIYLPRYANMIRKITNRQFFINHSNFTDSEKEKGTLERVVSESVMCMFHINDWNKNSKKIALFLNDNSSQEEFESLDNNLGRLEKIITDDIKDIFNSKDSFIWLTLFEHFTKLGVDDIKFAEFLRAFKDGLRDKTVEGKFFDTVDETGSTKDKSIIISKLHILETLMNEFLHINEEDFVEVDIFEFIKNNVKEDVTQDDIDFYNALLDDLTLNVVNDTKLLEKHNIPSLIGIVAYACENDKDLDEWIVDYFATHTKYELNQKNNFLHMKNDLLAYLGERLVA